MHVVIFVCHIVDFMDKLTHLWVDGWVHVWSSLFGLHGVWCVDVDGSFVGGWAGSLFACMVCARVRITVT